MGPLRRLMTLLFPPQRTPRRAPTVALTSGSRDTLPPAEENIPDRHYSVHPETNHVVETPDPHDSSSAWSRG